MKRIVSASSASAVFAALVIVTTTSKHIVRAVHAQSGCTNASLRGNYGLTFSGFLVEDNTPAPFYGEGLGTFDGAGNFSDTFAFSLNGTSSTGNVYTATYSVNPDCTGILVSTNGGDNFAFVIVGGAAEIFGTDISTPDTLNLDLKKQSRVDHDDGSEQ